MKRHIFLSLLIGCALYAVAQEGDIVVKASTKIPRNSTPQQVIDSLNKRFPNAKSVKTYKTTTKDLANGWEVEEENPVHPDMSVSMYTISFKRDDFQYYALYDANGNILMSKVEEYDSDVPEPVKASVRSLLGSELHNYSLLSKNYYKKTDNGKTKEYYEITILNKNDKKDKKTLVLAPDGTVLKTKG